MYRLLIVEDDPTIATSLRDHLNRWHYEVHMVTDFSAVTDLFLSLDPHLVLLDISLPFFDGYYWCAEIRKRSKVPVIFISSAGDTMSPVMAMTMGGDDFIAKPFDLAVVAAKIQALLRRTYDWHNKTDLLCHGNVTLDLSKTLLIYGDHSLNLTKNEFRILQRLMTESGATVSRDLIIEHLWESESFIDDNTLTVNMTRLRKKLAGIGLEGFIVTQKGLGYKVANYD